MQLYENIQRILRSTRSRRTNFTCYSLKTCISILRNGKLSANLIELAFLWCAISWNMLECRTTCCLNTLCHLICIILISLHITLCVLKDTITTISSRQVKLENQAHLKCFHITTVKLYIYNSHGPFLLSQKALIFILSLKSCLNIITLAMDDSSITRHCFHHTQI